MQITEYLTIREYAKRAKVAESTVYKWMREGKTLREGVHYVRMGRSLRFLYPQCLQAPAVEGDAVAPASEAARHNGAISRTCASRGRDGVGRRPPGAPRVNFDFDIA